MLVATLVSQSVIYADIDRSHFNDTDVSVDMVSGIDEDSNPSLVRVAEKDISVSKVLKLNKGENNFTVEGQYISYEQYLMIIPQNGINEGKKIIVNISSGTFCDVPEYKAANENTYDELTDQYVVQEMTLAQVLRGCLGNATDELPYKVTKLSDKSLSVELFPIYENWCDIKGTVVAPYADVLYYYIPLDIVVGDNNTVLTVDSFDSGIPVGFSKEIIIAGGKSPTESTTESATEITTETTTEIDTKPWGEADGSSVLTGNDAAMILLHALAPEKSNLNAEAKIYYDINGDGKIDSGDASEILQKVINADHVFSVKNKK